MSQALPLYHSVPYPSLIPLRTELDGRPPPWKSDHARDILIAGSFGHRVNMGEFPVLLRERLSRRCSDANASCTVVSTQAGMATIAGVFWRAQFCLQPGGDTVSRKSILDALLLGCIPVLFHVGQRMQVQGPILPAVCHASRATPLSYLQWPWHWREWVNDATVLFDADDVLSGRLDVPEALRAVPAARVAQMRATIARYAHRMQYSAVDSQALRESGALPANEEDAFGRLLQGVWQLSRAPSNQAKGRLRQARAAAAAARGASGHAHAHDAQHEEGCRCSLQASGGPGRRRERQAQGTDVIR